MTKEKQDPELDSTRLAPSEPPALPSSPLAVPDLTTALEPSKEKPSTKMYKTKVNTERKSEQLEWKKPKRQSKTKGAAKKQKLIDKRLQKDLKIDKVELKRLKKKLAKAEGFPERGIETWFRLTSRNLYTRRQIVDAKANLLVTINALILSLVLGTLYRSLAESPHLVYATVPLVLASLVSIAYAISASRPRLQTGVFSEQDLLEHRVSLMTFDDFYAMPVDEYERALDRVMQDRELLYGTIKRDIHALGVDLSRRYKNIHRAYGVFFFGIVLSTVMFSLCHIMYA